MIKVFHNRLRYKIIVSIYNLHPTIIEFLRVYVFNVLITQIIKYNYFVNFSYSHKLTIIIGAIISTFLKVSLLKTCLTIMLELL